MSHLLYLMFRCDEKFGEIGVTKHRQRKRDCFMRTCVGGKIDRTCDTRGKVNHM